MARTEYNIITNKLGFKVGLPILEFARGKKTFCIFAKLKGYDTYNDLLSYILYWQQFAEIRYTTVDFFDDRTTNFNDIKNKYDMIIVLEGKRFAKKYDAECFKINEKIAKIIISTKKLFTQESTKYLLLNFDSGIVDYKDTEKGQFVRVFKDKYKYLLT
jgi:hypothetical protein